jgi:Sec-independent protein secretion pathway component TatC
MMEALGRLFPNLAAMDLRQWVVDQVYVPPSYMMVVSGMALAYLVVVLVIGIIAFNQKQM